MTSNPFAPKRPTMYVVALEDFDEQWIHAERVFQPLVPANLGRVHALPWYGPRPRDLEVLRGSERLTAVCGQTVQLRTHMTFKPDEEGACETCAEGVARGELPKFGHPAERYYARDEQRNREIMDRMAWRRREVEAGRLDQVDADEEDRLDMRRLR